MNRRLARTSIIFTLSPLEVLSSAFFPQESFHNDVGRVRMPQGARCRSDV